MIKKNDDSVFKALMLESSIYKHHVELKEDALTEEGFFDFTKVPGLRLVGAGQFLRDLRLESGLTQEDVAKIVGISSSQIANWETNIDRTPLQALVKLAERLAISKEQIYWLMDQGEFSLKTALPVKFEKIRAIIPYFIPHKNNHTHKVRIIKGSKEILQRIKRTLNVKPHYRAGSVKIYSKELYSYLTTFFRYTKVSKIQPPLTNEVKCWHDNGVDLKRAVICPCLQTDGSAAKSIYFYGKSKSLHDYFVDAMYYEYKELPSSYFVWVDAAKNRATTYVRKTAEKIAEGLMKLAGNTKTSTAKGQTVKEYLQEPQPHLNYLLNADEAEQKIALRIWASTEGNINIRKCRYLIYPQIDIACAHPDLARQLIPVGKRFNIHFFKRFSKELWSGIHGLCINSLSSCINFLKLGGFIKGVKMQSSSRYHGGIDKDVVFLGILEFKKRQNTTKSLRDLSIKEAHYEINKIIKNKEYNTADYYVNYFS